MSQPQARTLPSFSARLCQPAAIAVTPLVASAGTLHCPKLIPHPQAITPPFLSARLCHRPAAISVTPLAASGGTVHWPRLSSPVQPQATTLPSRLRARLWLLPAP